MLVVLVVLVVLVDFGIVTTVRTAVINQIIDLKYRLCYVVVNTANAKIK